MSGSHFTGWQRKLLALSAAIASAVALAAGADTAADLVLAKVRAGVVSDLADLKGVACMESVERTRYAPRTGNRSASCGELIAATASTPQGGLEWRSRLRVDVSSETVAEVFSLIEHSRLEPNDVRGIVGTAAMGNGEFAGLLRSVVAGTAFQALGLQQTAAGRLLVFGFNGLYGDATYRGTLMAIPGSGDLRRLTMESDTAVSACRVQYAIDYSTTRVGDRDIIVPHSSTMDVVSKDGSETRNATYFSGCRRPGPDTVAAASPAPAPLPANVRLRVRFQPSIESATAATGDPVTAVIRNTVKDKQGGFIVHAGDRLHGRIAVIEEYLSPKPQWNIGVVFETIERGVGDHGIDQGVEQVVSLVRVGESPGGADLPKLPAGGGYFVVQGQNVVLDQKIETEWETR